MKKIIIKIDEYILRQLTTYLKRWIADRDYKEHKVDFQIKVQKIKLWGIFLLCDLLPTMGLIVSGRYPSAAFHVTIWSISVGLSYMRLQKTIHTTKLEHDILFSSRKNPGIYLMEKRVLEYMFIEMRKQRIAFSVFNFSICWLMSGWMFLLWLYLPVNLDLAVAIFFVFCPCIDLLEQYLFYVFDFDEPEGKKQVKESLTELLAREWQKIVEAFNPSPFPNPI